MNDWLTIIGALGGLEAIKWIVNFFVNHRTNARKENASADGLEMQNLLIVINTLKDEIARVMSEKIKRDAWASRHLQTVKSLYFPDSIPAGKRDFHSTYCCCNHQFYC